VPTLTGIYRNQWYAFDGSPSSALLSFHSPFLVEKVGVGATISHNTIGLHRDLQFALAYSYTVVNGERFKLRVGLSGMLRSLSLALDEANPLSTIDPSLDDKQIKDVKGNFGAGVYATYEDFIYFGFSVPRIVRNNIGINTTPGVTTAQEVPHFYGNLGAVLPMTEDLNLMPALLIKYVKNAPVSADINVNLEIKEKITAGLSYRTGGNGSGESLDLLAYYRINQMMGVGAAYDLTLSQLNTYTGGSFELLFQADLKRRSKGMTNPRFFL
jgi:type IX secretion system PorP/SprF family membrane protein